MPMAMFEATTPSMVLATFLSLAWVFFWASLSCVGNARINIRFSFSISLPLAPLNNYTSLKVIFKESGTLL